MRTPAVPRRRTWGCSASRSRSRGWNKPPCASRTAGYAIRWRKQLSSSHWGPRIRLSSILLIMSLGLAIVFGLMGVINMAHGELMMVGAYATFVTQECFKAYLPADLFDYYFLVSIPLSFLVAGLFGLFLEATVIRFLYGRPLETLLATWGVSLIMIQAARVYFGDLTSVVAPSWLSGGAQVMVGVYLPYNRLFIIALSTLCVVGIYLLLFRSGVGLRVRAVM